MGEDSVEQTGVNPEGKISSRAERRKAELLGVVFGLPKPDIFSTSVEKMPEEFSLSEEMVRLFKEIMTKEESDNIEHYTVGDSKRGRLFFEKVERGKEDRPKLSIGLAMKAVLSLVGLRRILIHSHGVEGDVRFSNDDLANFFVSPDGEIVAGIAKRISGGKEYGV